MRVKRRILFYCVQLLVRLFWKREWLLVLAEQRDAQLDVETQGCMSYATVSSVTRVVMDEACANATGMTAQAILDEAAE